MKVLFVSEYFWPRAAGGEVWAFELCEALAQRGHKVTVLATRHDSSPEKQDKAGMRILRPVRSGRGRLSRWLAARRLVSAVREQVSRERPDVIHVAAYTLNVPISRLARERGIRCVTAVHAYFGDAWGRISPLAPLLRWLERRALVNDLSHIIHVPSRYAQELIARDTGKPTLVLENWLPEHFPRPKRLQDTYVFVGSLEPVKDPLACIPASKGHRLVIIGSGSLERRMREAARRAGLDVTFIRKCTREEALAYLGGASLALVPSVRESFSMVALEAVAQGTPVSGNPVGILPELPGVVPFPPAATPPRLPRTQAAQVRRRFAKEGAIDKVLGWYGRSTS